MPLYINQWWTAATTTATVPIYDRWWTGATTTATVPTYAVWTANTTTNDYWYYPMFPIMRETEYQRERSQIHRVDQEQARRNREAAAARARDMLMTFLDEDQRVQFAANRSFIVEGRRNRYRIMPGRIGNIDVLPRHTDDRLLRRLCVHPEDPTLPIEDIMLSQLLHLRANEDQLVRTANVHPV